MVDPSVSQLARVPRRIRCALWVALGLTVTAVMARLVIGPLPFALGVPPDAPGPLALWPWPQIEVRAPYPGVTHWVDRSSPDGTILDLIQFDFAANPSLRLELYDQDEDDATPFDNEVLFWRGSVGATVRHLNESGRGPIIAAWNGAFFNFPQGRDMANAVARHLAPVVLRGEANYNVGSPRWAFGVKYLDGAPQFTTLHQPTVAELEGTYDFAAVSAQCLIGEGQPLALQAFPERGAPPPPQPVPSTPAEAGHIPVVDHMRTSRTSVGWSRDHRKLWLLVVKEPDSEAASIRAWRWGLPLMGGWTVADLQRFWQARGAWGAVNLDGGEITQMALRRSDGGYLVIPARQIRSPMRIEVDADMGGAPEAAASIMYFFVRDAAEDT